MPALNFKARFADLVLQNKKCQTIRAKRKDGRDPKPGDKLFLYSDLRTKNAKKLRIVTCRSVDSIHMSGGMVAMESVDIGGKGLSHHELDWLAQADGFKDWEDMRHWFFKEHGAPFHGLLIKW